MSEENKIPSEESKGIVGFDPFKITTHLSPNLIHSLDNNHLRMMHYQMGETKLSALFKLENS